MPTSAVTRTSHRYAGHVVSEDPSPYYALYTRLLTHVEHLHKQALSSWNKGIADWVVTPIIETLQIIPGFTNVTQKIVGKFFYPDQPLHIQEEAERFAKLAFSEKDIQKNFTVKEPTVISLKETCPGLSATILEMESKWRQASQPTVNLVLFTDNIGAYYEGGQEILPLARACVKFKSTLPKVRLIVISAQKIQLDGIPCKAAFCDTSAIHTGIINYCTENYGKISLMIGCSLGCVVMGQLMKQIDIESAPNYPTNWWFHVGPTSIEKMSAFYWFGRSVGFPLLKSTGWDSAPEQAIEFFLEKMAQFSQKTPSISVSGLAGDADYHFPEEAGLCNSAKIEQLKEQEKIAHIVRLKVPHMLYHSRAHHGLPLHSYRQEHEINLDTEDFAMAPMHSENTKETFIQDKETLADAIIRYILIEKKAS